MWLYISKCYKPLSYCCTFQNSTDRYRVAMFPNKQFLFCWKFNFDKFDVHRAVHRNIISIVKQTRCTGASSLFYYRNNNFDNKINMVFC